MNRLGNEVVQDMTVQSAGGDTATMSGRPASAVSAQIFVLAALASVGTFATSILLPSLPSIARTLNVSTAAVASTISVYLAVFALGQLLVGPVSDRYGRWKPVVAGLLIFIAGSIWCELSNDLPTLLVGRGIQALGACAASVLSRAIARDLLSGEELTRALAFITIAMAHHQASRRCSAAYWTRPSAGGPNSLRSRCSASLSLCFSSASSARRIISTSRHRCNLWQLRAPIGIL